MAGVEDFVGDHAFFLERGDVFADTVVEDWVVAFGEEFVDFLFEGFDFFEVFKNAVFFVLGFGGIFVGNVALAVFKSAFAMFDVNRTQAHQLVAAPFIDNDIAVKTLLGAAGKMPDKWRFRQIHEQIEMIRQLSKEIFIQVIIYRATKHRIKARILGHAKAFFDEFGFDAFEKGCFPGIGYQGHDTVFVYHENFADHIGKKFHGRVCMRCSGITLFCLNQYQTLIGLIWWRMQNSSRSLLF